MQASRMVPAVFAAVAVGATDTNPLAKVLDLMDECTAKVKADGEAEAKAYKEYFEWCDDVAKNTQFEIKTAKASVEKLTASIAKLTSDIEVGTSKIGDLAAAIATNDADLKEANSVREKEAADFTAAEAELADGVDTLGRAIGIIERESAKNPAAFAQIDTSNMQKLTQAIGAVVDAAAFTGNDKQKLMALVQNQASDDDDDESGAPAPDAYKSHSGGILDVLGDMKDKAEADLSELRKAETNAKQNFNMLKGSLEGEIAADTKDKKEETNDKSAAEEEKSVAEGDLSQTSKDLSAAEADLAKATHGCLTAAADHEATVAARQEELTVIAEAKKILQETTSGAVGQSYSLLQLGSQLRTHSDLIRSEVVTAVRRLAKQQHSSALAQLSSKIEAAMQYGSVGGEDVFAKIKGLIGDMIAKLEQEAEADATEKAYCDEEMAKTEAKKQELDGEIEVLSTKIDRAASKSAALKEDVKEAQQELAAVAKEQAEMDKMRQEENANFKVAQADLQLGLSGVQAALEKLREYYGGAAAAFVQDDNTFGTFMQQPAAPAKHEKSSGAGQSIIGILEVCESDFSKNLAAEEQQESDAVEEYETTTQENKITKATRNQDVKYKTQEFKSLDKEITELSGDKETSNTELAAVMEYYGKIKDRCVAKPETYEERTKRRTAEIEGLKQALTILENETAFVQRKSHGHLRRTIQ